MLHRVIKTLAHGAALVGGAVLMGLVVLTTLSIVGRELSKLGHGLGDGGLGALILATGVNEIRGTYELTEAGVAFAIFAFLPICQFYGQHATVDVFTSGLRGKAQAWLRAFWEVVLSVIVIFITMRLSGGFERYWNNGETTLFLQFPLWWAYATALCAAVVASIVAAYCAVARVLEAATGDPVLPQG